MFVQGNQGSKRRRGEEREDDTVTGAIAFEDLALDQRLARIGADFLADLLLGLAEGESLGLGEEVGEEDAVMQRAAQRIVRRGRGEEVRRDELGTLVYELVEGVLPIGSGGTPDDRLQILA